MKLFTARIAATASISRMRQCLNCGNLVLYDPRRRPSCCRATGIFLHQRRPNAAATGWPSRRQAFCRACALNKTIPDLSVDGNRERWIRVEAAKKRAIYSLLAFGLPVGPKADPDDEVGIAFDFLADPIGGGRAASTS